MGSCESIFGVDELNSINNKKNLGLMIAHYEYIEKPNETIDDHITKLAQEYPDHKKFRIRWEMVDKGKVLIYIFDKTKDPHMDGLF